MTLLAAGSPLRRLKHQRRFYQPQSRILLLRDSYHVQQECRAALVELGHEVVDVWVPQDPAPDAMLKAVLNAAVVWRPDALLSINAFGFDRADWMTEVIEAMGLPTAIWWVDSPLLVLRGWLALTCSTIHHFVWDRAYVPLLRRLGAEHVHHLPLAASRARHLPALVDGTEGLRFIGGSLTHAPDAWSRYLTTTQQREARTWLEQVETQPDTLLEMVPQPGPPVCVQVMAQGLVQAELSRQRRHTAMDALGAFPLEIYGDSGWKAAHISAAIYGQVPYGRPLDQLYRGAAIALNITSAQMPQGVNQRVFDVPQCGGFLLSDNQPELANFFELGQEMAVFDSNATLAEAASEWLGRPKDRQAMIARAQRRIAAEHLFSHRLDTLVGQLRRDHGPMRFRSLS